MQFFPGMTGSSEFVQQRLVTIQVIGNCGSAWLRLHPHSLGMLLASLRILIEKMHGDEQDRNVLKRDEATGEIIHRRIMPTLMQMLCALRC